jgi:hypothetical protein
MAAGTGLEMLLIAVIDQRVEAVDAFNEYVSASAAIAPVGTTEFNEFFAAKGDAACAPIARANKDFCLIKKLHALSLQQIG